jgi:hypothetical protein
MASVSVIPKIIQLGRDGPLGRQFAVGVALLDHELAPDFGRGQPSIQAVGAELRVGLALAIDNGGDIVEQVGEVLLGTLAAAQGHGIQTGEALVEFAPSCAEGLAVPAEFAFRAPLATAAQLLDGARHKAAARAPFKHLRRLDE